MKTILVVDDEFDIASSLGLLLQLEGYDVVEASNGKEALRKICETRPDLVLSDIMMPVMDGLELLSEIKGSPELRKIPVIVMSAGRFDGEDHTHPWDAFLAKPIGLDELLDTIHRLLN